MEQQTAIEWLIQRLVIQSEDGKYHIEVPYGDGKIDVTPIIEQANQKFKEQITDAHIEGQRVFDNYPHTQWTNDQAEQYYNETFKQ